MAKPELKLVTDQKPPVRLEDIELGELQRQANEARLLYETAQQKVITAIYRTMAEQGLKPKDWVVKQDTEGFFCEQVIKE